MSPDQKLFENISGFAAKMFNDTGSLQPMWILEDRDGNQTALVTPFDGDDTKEKVAEYLAEFIRERHIVRYGFMSEAYVLEVGKDHPDYDRAERLRPSQHQDRREVLNFHVESADGQIGGQYYILRPEYGKAKLSPLKEMDGNAIGGRFANLLFKAAA